MGRGSGIWRWEREVGSGRWDEGTGMREVRGERWGGRWGGGIKESE